MERRNTFLRCSLRRDRRYYTGCERWAKASISTGVQLQLERNGPYLSRRSEVRSLPLILSSLFRTRALESYRETANLASGNNDISKSKTLSCMSVNSPTIQMFAATLCSSCDVYACVYVYLFSIPKWDAGGENKRVHPIQR